MHTFGVEAVAKQAGVNRTTVYRHFSSRTDLIVATLARASRRFNTESVLPHLADLQDPVDLMVEGLVMAYVLWNEDPVLSQLVSGDWIDAGLLRATMTPDYQRVVIDIQGVGEALGLRPERAEYFAEVTVRFFSSLLLLPPRDSSRPALRRLIREAYLPALGIDRPRE